MNVMCNRPDFPPLEDADEFLSGSTIARLARPHYLRDDPGHDWSHIARVTRTCGRLGRELGAELAILFPASVLHDLVNVRKDDPARTAASTRAAAAGEPLLRAAQYSEERIQQIGCVIVEHSYTLGRPSSSLEAAILQDADRLDALGAIGILRAATCGTLLGAAYYELGDPFALSRGFDDSQFTVDHFFTKLLNLPASLNTVPARREGQRRVEAMQDFLCELGFEIGAKYITRPTSETLARADQPKQTNPRSDPCRTS